MDITSAFNRPSRIVAGVMSGTSVDGIDAVVVRIDGSGQGVTIDVLGHHFEPYDASVRDRILANSDPAGGRTREISQLNALLPRFFERAVRGAAQSAGVDMTELDLVGCHGQTIHHVPEPEAIAGFSTVSTLQIGDPSILATRLEKPVVGDFRQADMALGGQGAPLAPYLDFALFSHTTESRVLLNLGGIANVTLLPGRCSRDQVVAFDTGPANMIIDALTDRLFGKPFDKDGVLASAAPPDSAVLEHLLTDEFVRRRPPKSTGRERFGRSYSESILEMMSQQFGSIDTWTDLQRSTAISTATEFTVASVEHGIRIASDTTEYGRVIVSGGGAKNRTLMDRLSRILHPAVVEPIDRHGILSAEKEAVCFALLAHEVMNGVATGMPSVTGASATAMQGKICLPH